MSKTECVLEVNEEEKHGRNELRAPSPVSSHLDKYPPKAPGGGLLISQPRPYMRRDTAGLSERPPRRQITHGAAYARHSIPSVKVQYPPLLWIYQRRHGNLRSWGTLSGVLVQRSQMEEVEYQSESLTFRGRSSNAVLSRGGQESRAPGSLPSGIRGG